jgi:endonuclease YncB( thermonuclease family)
LPHGAAKVIDGDSIVIADQLVRLDGIDAPELGQTFWWRGQRLVCGTMPLSALEALIAARPTRVEIVAADRAMRLIPRLAGVTDHDAVPDVGLAGDRERLVGPVHRIAGQPPRRAARR